MPIEYGGEEQAIVAVGLARPRPGVFVEAIQHLLVLCTTTEVGCIGSGLAGIFIVCLVLFINLIHRLLVLCTTIEVRSLDRSGNGRRWRSSLSASHRLPALLLPSLLLALPACTPTHLT